MTSPGPSADIIRLTPAEVLYLFSLSTEPESTAIRERLGLPAPDAHPELVGAGAGSLLARGLAVRDGDLLRLTPESGLIGYVLTHATVRTEVGMAAPEGVSATVLLTADSLTRVLMARELGIFDTLFVNPESTTGEFVRRLATEFLDGGTDRMLVVRSSADDAERSVGVILTAPDRWRLADSVPRPTDGDLTEDALTDTPRDDALAAVGTVPW